MAEVDTPHALLVMAVQDLYDGECAMVERLGTVRDNLTDEALRDLVEDDQLRSAEQRDAFAEIAQSLDAEPQAEPNIWLRAILDDADNDAKTIQHGPLRDIAIAGALRKAKQSQRVSYETALVPAERLGMEGEEFRGMVARAEYYDCALMRLLHHRAQTWGPPTSERLCRARYPIAVRTLQTHLD